MDGTSLSGVSLILAYYIKGQSLKTLFFLSRKTIIGIYYGIKWYHNIEYYRKVEHGGGSEKWA